MARILIMDDEQAIRNIFKAMFTKLGFEVEDVTGGEDAIKSYRTAYNSNRAFDLVVMDLVIPGGVGGKEVIKSLLDIDPNTNAVISSGFSNDPVIENYKDFGFQGVIVKPFTFNDVKELVGTRI